MKLASMIFITLSILIGCGAEKTNSRLSHSDEDLNLGTLDLRGQPREIYGKVTHNKGFSTKGPKNNLYYFASHLVPDIYDMNREKMEDFRLVYSFKDVPAGTYQVFGKAVHHTPYNDSFYISYESDDVQGRQLTVWDLKAANNNKWRAVDIRKDVKDWKKLKPLIIKVNKKQDIDFEIFLRENVSEFNGLLLHRIGSN